MLLHVHSLRYVSSVIQMYDDGDDEFAFSNTDIANAGKLHSLLKGHEITHYPQTGPVPVLLAA